MTKVHCDQCQRWLARYEGSQVIFFCPRCKQETVVEIVVLAKFLEQWLFNLRVQSGDVQVSGDGKGDTGPLTRRTLMGGGRRKGGGGAA